jgi:hypothetical protein
LGYRQCWKDEWCLFHVLPKRKATGLSVRSMGEER